MIVLSNETSQRLDKNVVFSVLSYRQRALQWLRRNTQEEAHQGVDDEVSGEEAGPASFSSSSESVVDGSNRPVS